MKRFISKLLFTEEILFSLITMTCLAYYASINTVNAITLSTTSNLLTKDMTRQSSNNTTSVYSPRKTIFNTDSLQIQKVFDQPIQNSKIIIHYVNEEGIAIAPDEVINGYIGEKYSTSPKEFTDYVLDYYSKNTSGTFNNNTQSITYIYHKISPAEAAEQAKHFPGDGNDVIGIGIDEKGAGVEVNDTFTKNLSHKKVHKKNQVSSGIRTKIKANNLKQTIRVNRKLFTQHKFSKELPRTGINACFNAVVIGLGSIAIIGSLAGSWYIYKKL